MRHVSFNLNMLIVSINENYTVVGETINRPILTHSIYAYEIYTFI